MSAPTGGETIPKVAAGSKPKRERGDCENLVFSEGAARAEDMTDDLVAIDGDEIDWTDGCAQRPGVLDDGDLLVPILSGVGLPLHSGRWRPRRS